VQSRLSCTLGLREAAESRGEVGDEIEEAR
jgi:hypothetical protein